MAETKAGSPEGGGVDELLRGDVRVVNIGLSSFARELKRSDVAVIQVNWSPPATSNKKILDLLAKLSS